MFFSETFLVGCVAGQVLPSLILANWEHHHMARCTAIQPALRCSAALFAACNPQLINAAPQFGRSDVAVSALDTLHNVFLATGSVFNMPSAIKLI